MDDRSYILQRLQSKKVSIEEFNFDSLQAPPLHWFLSPYDISMLHEMAHSLRLSAKPDIKLKEMDSLLRSRGLVKFGAGTNRIVYRHPEFQNILFKIGYDDVGLGDNPAEFKNQMLLKPFVSKMFEVSPCGTVAVVERLVPTKSREEFLSIADDYFTLLNEFILGHYIMADIGSRFFMNTATRKYFGVCLIDYPYLYELDGNKLYCRKPDQTSQSGKCDGIIDYDDGFNVLHCTKCGAIYKAKELRKNIESNEIKIEKAEGEYKMNIKISGGTNKIAATNITTNQDSELIFKEVKKSMPVKKPVEKTVNGVQVKDTKKEESKITVGDIIAKDENAPTDEAIDSILDLDNKESMVNKYVEETAEDLKTSREQCQVNVEVGKKVSSPIEISEEIKEEALANKEPEEEKNPNDLVDEAIRVIADNIDKIKLDAVKYQFIERLIKTFVENNTTTRMFEILMDSAKYIYRECNDDIFEEVCANEDLRDLLKKIYDFNVRISEVEYNDKEDKLSLDIETEIFYAYQSDMEKKDEVEALTFKDEIVDVKSFIGYDEIPAERAEPDVPEENTSSPTTLSFYDAKVININSIFPGQTSKKGQDIIVFTDSNNNYVANGNGIIAADIVNSINVNDIEICSKEWVQSVREVLDKDEPIEAPVGALQPEAKVDDGIEEAVVDEGQTMEEFLDEEKK